MNVSYGLCGKVFEINTRHWNYSAMYQISHENNLYCFEDRGLESEVIEELRNIDM